MILLDKIADRLGYTPKMATRTLHCAWCGEDFTWTGNISMPLPSYCNKGHRTAAKKARSKRRKEYEYSSRKKKKVYDHGPDLSTVGKCPTPFKRVYVTRELAEEAIQRVDPDMHVYKCPCGALHIGHRRNSRKTVK